MQRLPRGILYAKHKEERQNLILAKGFNNDNRLIQSFDDSNASPLKKKIKRNTNTMSHTRGRDSTSTNERAPKRPAPPVPYTKEKKRKLQESNSDKNETNSNKVQKYPSMPDLTKIIDVSDTRNENVDEYSQIEPLALVKKNNTQNSDTDSEIKTARTRFNFYNRNNLQTPVENRKEGGGSLENNNKTSLEKSRKTSATCDPASLNKNWFNTNQQISSKHSLPLSTVPEMSKYRNFRHLPIAPIQPLQLTKKDGTQVMNTVHFTVSCATQTDFCEDFPMIQLCNDAVRDERKEIVDATGIQIINEDHVSNKLASTQTTNKIDKQTEVVYENGDIIFIDEDILPEVEQKKLQAPVSNETIEKIIATSTENKKIINYLKKAAMYKMFMLKVKIKWQNYAKTKIIKRLISKLNECNKLRRIQGPVVDTNNKQLVERQPESDKMYDASHYDEQDDDHSEGRLIISEDIECNIAEDTEKNNTQKPDISAPVVVETSPGYNKVKKLCRPDPQVLQHTQQSKEKENKGNHQVRDPRCNRQEENQEQVRSQNSTAAENQTVAQYTQQTNNFACAANTNVYDQNHYNNIHASGSQNKGYDSNCQPGLANINSGTQHPNIVYGFKVPYCLNNTNSQNANNPTNGPMVQMVQNQQTGHTFNAYNENGSGSFLGVQSGYNISYMQNRQYGGYNTNNQNEFFGAQNPLIQNQFPPVLGYNNQNDIQVGSYIQNGFQTPFVTPNQNGLRSVRSNIRTGYQGSTGSNIQNGCQGLPGSNDQNGVLVTTNSHRRSSGSNTKNIVQGSHGSNKQHGHRGSKNKNQVQNSHVPNNQNDHHGSWGPNTNKYDLVSHGYNIHNGSQASRGSQDPYLSQGSHGSQTCQGTQASVIQNSHSIAHSSNDPNTQKIVPGINVQINQYSACSRGQNNLGPRSTTEHNGLVQALPVANVIGQQQQWAATSKAISTAHTGNDRIQYPMAPPAPISPRHANTMPEWLWYSRRWPCI